MTTNLYSFTNLIKVTLDFPHQRDLRRARTGQRLDDPDDHRRRESDLVYGVAGVEGKTQRHVDARSDARRFDRRLDRRSRETDLERRSQRDLQESVGNELERFASIQRRKPLRRYPAISWKSELIDDLRHCSDLTDVMEENTTP